jgi:hypothetical protein
MERIGDEVRVVLGRFGTPGQIAEVARVWPSVVGDAIAKNAWPARIGRDGTLHVAASSSAWAFELTQLEATLLNRLRRELGRSSPKRLRFTPGRLPERGLDETEAVRPRGPHQTPADRERAAELANAIEDEQLRQLVVRAAAASLASARSDLLQARFAANAGLFS